MFFLEAGLNHFGKIKEANKILNFFLKSTFNNLTFMIHNDSFYKSQKKRGLDFLLPNEFYKKAIKKCHNKKKKLDYQSVMKKLFIIIKI